MLLRLSYVKIFRDKRATLRGREVLLQAARHYRDCIRDCIEEVGETVQDPTRSREERQESNAIGSKLHYLDDIWNLCNIYLLEEAENVGLATFRWLVESVIGNQELMACMQLVRQMKESGYQETYTNEDGVPIYWPLVQKLTLHGDPNYLAQCLELHSAWHESGPARGLLQRVHHMLLDPNEGLVGISPDSESRGVLGGPYQKRARFERWHNEVVELLHRSTFEGFDEAARNGLSKMIRILAGDPDTLWAAVVESCGKGGTDMEGLNSQIAKMIARGSPGNAQALVTPTAWAVFVCAQIQYRSPNAQRFELRALLVMCYWLCSRFPHHGPSA